MARASTKCSKCGDLLWFRDIDTVPQRSICGCGATYLLESGAAGSGEEPSEEEKEAMD